eukprot:gnl/Chilomastix_cuspidata/2734.p1 GENE.gnl/Chilomastix_cuspidata/2734~~gnl/Chilomastix_cuspidata/2734.p1  ORF type:complete len:1004 (+),score=407.97 gnl/Chilomastix_cuspidata/2734:2273-5284(+)
MSQLSILDFCGQGKRRLRKKNEADEVPQKKNQILKTPDIHRLQVAKGTPQSAGPFTTPRTQNTYTVEPSTPTPHLSTGFLSAFNASSTPARTPSPALGSPSSPVKPYRASLSPSPAAPRPAKQQSKRFRFLEDIRDAEQRPPSHPDYDASTLYISSSDYARMTEFERQFWRAKAAHFSSIILFRKGSFWEIYETDADVVSRELDLKISYSRGMKLSGFPLASYTNFVRRLLSLGYSVYVVDELERISEKVGKCIRRGIVSAVSPATILDPDLVSSPARSILLALCFAPDAIGAAALDVSAGRVQLLDFAPTTYELGTQLFRLEPSELLYQGAPQPPLMRLVRTLFDARSILRDRQPPQSREDALVEIAHLPPKEVLDALERAPDVTVSAFAHMCRHLREMLLDSAVLPALRVDSVAPSAAGSRPFQLHSTAIRTLSVLKDSETGATEGSLLKRLNRASSPFGKRYFSTFLTNPMGSPAAIVARQQSVAFFRAHAAEADSVAQRLRALADLERSFTFIRSGMTVREKHVSDFLSGMAAALELAEQLRAMAVPGAVAQLADFKHREELQRQYDAVTARCFFASERVTVRPEQDEALRDANAQMQRAVGLQAEILRDARRALGTDSVSYKQIGKQRQLIATSNDARPPRDWRLISRTKTESRYHTPQSAHAIEMLVAAENAMEDARTSAFFRVIVAPLREQAFALNIRILINALAEVDCILALALAADPDWVLPEIVAPQDGAEGHGACFVLARGLKHPCRPDFVPNNVALGRPSQEHLQRVFPAGQGAAHTPPSHLLVLTGGNMSGKSTYLKMTSCLVLLAQLGSPVPAAAAALTPLDGIIARCGAMDEIFFGRSTFLVELQDCAEMIHKATPRTLCIVDELGRGTSTADGRSVAEATLHELYRRGVPTLAATHSQGTAALFASMGATSLMTSATVVKSESTIPQVEFSHKVVEGVSPTSFGVSVAMTAGLDMSIIERAHKLSLASELAEIESLHSAVCQALKTF